MPFEAPLSPLPTEAATLALREARRLQRAARADALSSSLPVLRRLIAAQVLTGTSLPSLHRSRHIVQRKHLLRLLAVEAGSGDWASYRAALRQAEPDEQLRLHFHAYGAATFNPWFASEAEAQRMAPLIGGRVLRVGAHALVLTPEAECAVRAPLQ